MKRGDRVQVLGVLDPEGRPAPCTLQVWHPDTRATARSAGEWDYVTEDGREGSRTPDDISPWPEG